MTILELKKELDKYPDSAKVEVLLIGGINVFFKAPDYIYYDEDENKVVIDPND